MSERFWKFIHDSAEKLWHWVYYNKIAPPKKPTQSGYQYNIVYMNSNREVCEFDGTTNTVIGERRSVE